MKSIHFLPLAALAALGLAAAMPAHAQTVITGQHNNNTSGNGYLANGPGAYAVPVDTTTPSATFNHNSNDGLLVQNNATISVSGGQFLNNGQDGMEIINGSQATVQGGMFNNNVFGLVGEFSSTLAVTDGQFNGNQFDGLLVNYSSTATVSGGAFSSNGYGIVAYYFSSATVSGGQFINDGWAAWAQTNANITLTGGDFSGSKLSDLYLFDGTATMDLYGAFSGMSVGQTRTLTATGTVNSFTGQLEFSSAPHTFTYSGGTPSGLPGGTITLHDVALAPAPEPSPYAALSIGVLGLSALVLRAHRRSAA